VGDVTLKESGVRADLGTTKLEGKEPVPAINVQDFKVAKPEDTRREAMGEERVYLKLGRKSRDAQTQFGILERQLELMMKRGENAEALTDGELEMALKIIAKLPGRREGRRELSLYVAGMILKVNDEGFKGKKEGKKDKPEDVWEEFKKGKNIEELGEKHPEMGLVYEYIKIHGKDPGEVGWKEVLTYGRALAAISEKKKISKEVLKEIAENATYGIDADTTPAKEQKIKEDLYQKLLAKEGYGSSNKTAKEWKNDGAKESVFSLWLGLRHENVVVDVERYWKQRRLLPVVNYRLKRMRSQAVARVKDKGKPKDKGEKKEMEATRPKDRGKKEMMEITRPKDMRKEEYWKGYNSALALEDLASKTLLGRYLDEMGEGAYWRGKAKLDHAYLGLYMGILIDHPEAAMRSGMIGNFAKMSSDTLGDHIRSYTGVQANYEMAQDERVIDVLNHLYFLTDEPYGVKLKRLGEKYGFDPKGDLPDFVTDAVMMEKVFMMDIKNMYTSDRRQQIMDPAGFYLRKAVTYRGPMDDGLYRVVEMMGNHFKFCEGILMKMGFVSAMNIKENYHAIVPDEEREFDPEKYPDQKDLIWQYMFMFALQLRKKPLRRMVEKGDEVNYKVPPGLAAEFMVYSNWRKRKGKDDKKEKFDHREGVFNRFLEVLKEDGDLISERGRGKAGLGMELVENSGITVRKAMLTVLEDFSRSIDETIDGVEINTNGHEIFYNDEVAELLVRYEEYRDAGKTGNADFDDADKQKRLKSLLNLRNVLRDHRAWGLVWSIDEPEVIKRLEHLKDFEYAERYIHSGADPKKHLLELVKADPFQSLEEMKLTPDAVLKTFTNMGHRLLGHLYERNIGKLFLFAEQVVLIRASQLEIPDAKTLRQMIDPQGEVRVGAASGSYDPIKDGEVAMSKVHGAIWDKMRELGYMKKILQLRLRLINEGFYKRWDDAVSAEAMRILLADAFEWPMTRDLALKQEWTIYNELGVYQEREEPVESYLVCDVVVKGGENSPPVFQTTDMAIQSLNRKQIKLFFTDLREKIVNVGGEDKIVIDEELGIQKAGDIFGGLRQATVQLTGGEVEVKTGASEEASGAVDSKGKAVLVAGGQQVVVFQIWEEWVKVGMTQVNGEWVEAGWLKLDELEGPGFIGHDVEGYRRPGERMYQGSRFVWNGKESKWDSVLGEWRLDRKKDLMYFYKEGSELVVKGDLTEEQKNSGDPYNNENKGVVEGFKRELDLGEINPKTGKVEKGQINPKTDKVVEATFPFLVFKSEAHRSEFFDERMAMIFSLLFGRAREELALKGGQAAVPLRGKLYDSKSAGLAQIIRGGYLVQTMMRFMERKNACKVILFNMLNDFFGIKPPSEALLESHMEAYRYLMQSRLWGEDREAVLRFANELSVIQLLQEDLKMKERPLNIGEQWAIRGANWMVKAGMKALSWEIKPIGIPINAVFLAIAVVPQILGSSIPLIDQLRTQTLLAEALRNLKIGEKLGFIGLQIVVATWLTTKARNWLIKKVKIDPESANLGGIGYLNEFKAPVPVQ